MCKDLLVEIPVKQKVEGARGGSKSVQNIMPFRLVKVDQEK
jgi:hypothetical protein